MVRKLNKRRSPGRWEREREIERDDAREAEDRSAEAERREEPEAQGISV